MDLNLALIVALAAFNSLRTVILEQLVGSLEVDVDEHVQELVVQTFDVLDGVELLATELFSPELVAQERLQLPSLRLVQEQVVQELLQLPYLRLFGIWV